MICHSLSLRSVVYAFLVSIDILFPLSRALFGMEQVRGEAHGAAVFFLQEVIPKRRSTPSQVVALLSLR